MKLGVTGLGGLWPESGRGKLFFGQIDRYWQDQYTSVNFFI